MHITSRHLIETVMLLGLGLASAALAKPPNIVVILTDDQGYADIGFNPNHPSEVTTPHMDELAREGVFFSQAYTSGHVCSPTRAGLMLGQYQQRVGIYTAGDGNFTRMIPVQSNVSVALVIGEDHYDVGRLGQGGRSQAKAKQHDGFD